MTKSAIATAFSMGAFDQMVPLNLFAMVSVFPLYMGVISTCLLSRENYNQLTPIAYSQNKQL